MKKALGTNADRFNDDRLQLGGALARKLNNDKPHWTKPVTGSGLAFKMSQWDSAGKIIAQVQVLIMCNVNLCVKHFVIFHTSQTLAEDREMIA